MHHRRIWTALLVCFLASVGSAHAQHDPAFRGMWGTVGSGPGQFSEPVDVTVDAAGLIYVVDMFNHRIQKFGRQPVPTVRVSWGELKSSYR